MEPLEIAIVLGIGIVIGWFGGFALAKATFSKTRETQWLHVVLSDLYEIGMQATRMNRASDEKPYLIVDLVRIKRLADRAIALLNEKPYVIIDVDEIIALLERSK